MNTPDIGKCSSQVHRPLELYQTGGLTACQLALLRGKDDVHVITRCYSVLSTRINIVNVQ